MPTPGRIPGKASVTRLRAYTRRLSQLTPLARPRATALRILLVEDEAPAASEIEKILRSLGYDLVATVATGEDAVVTARATPVDLALVDIRLAGALDGIETAIALRDATGVPTVFVTAHADFKTVDRAKAAEPVGYVLKPIDRAELRVVIELGLHKHALGAKLRERERWFSTTLRSIGDGVLAVDTRGRVTFMNAEAERVLGAASSALEGRQLDGLGAFYLSGGDARVESPVSLALRTRDVAALGASATLLTEDGRETPLDGSAAPILDEDGSSLGAVLVFKDVTERRALESRLATADRLAALGTVAAGVAHEINNPLAFAAANVRAAITALEATREQEPALASRLADVVAGLLEATIGTDRVARIVEDLRGFAPPILLAPTIVDVAACVEGAVRTTRHETEPRARVQVSIEPRLVVLADERRLTQVFVNLITNTAQAIPAGAADEHLISLSARAAGDRAVITVTDTGCGMSRELQKRIFTPLFSTRETGGGMGLGLALAHAFVTSFGGTLEVRSVEARGTTIEISLPSARSAPTPSSIAPARLARLLPSWRVLFIDDEPLLVRAIERMLGSHHTLVTATSAARGLEFVLGAEVPFDVVVCDLTMPGMSGQELHERLRASRPDTAARMVFVSGGATSERAAKFLDTVPWVRKPFTRDEIELAMARVVED